MNKPQTVIDLCNDKINWRFQLITVHVQIPQAKFISLQSG